MQTEGIGGPCPRCEGMNCFIKKGSGTWYTFIACSDCYFGYGEHADNMREKTGGIVAGAEVWHTLLYSRRRKLRSIEDIKSLCDYESVEYTVETPFEMSDVEEWALNLCVPSENLIEDLVEQTSVTEEEMKWEFIQAVENDEYEEFYLNNDLVVITDYEGDGELHPYILDKGDYTLDEVQNLVDSKMPFLDYKAIAEDNEEDWHLEHASVMSNETD